MKALLADAKKKRVLLAGAIVLGSILLAILIDALEGYEGLGEAGQVPENTYDMSLLYEQGGRFSMKMSDMRQKPALMCPPIKRKSIGRQ